MSARNRPAQSVFHGLSCGYAANADDVASLNIAAGHAATAVLTAHVPLPLAEKVDQMAEQLERSHGWIMKQARSAWIAQEEEQERLTREALADVDAGHGIDHQAVQAWADSLGPDEPLPEPR